MTLISDSKKCFVFFIGTSKIAAKNNASEKALRDLVIQKMVQVPKSVLNANAALSGEGKRDAV